MNLASIHSLRNQIRTQISGLISNDSNVSELKFKFSKRAVRGKDTKNTQQTANKQTP